MNKKEITFDKLPEAIGIIMEEISLIKDYIRQNKTVEEKPLPVGIDEACRIVGKAKPTIYSLVHKGLIPCYKIGKKLYFYEAELLQWITSGRKKNIVETKESIEQNLKINTRSRRNKSEI